MNPIPDVPDPERYTDSSFIDSGFIMLENDDAFVSQVKEAQNE